MADLFISLEQAENDLLAAAAFLAERIRSSDGHAEAMASIIPQYLKKGDVDLGAELANAISDPHSRDKLLLLVAERCAEVGDDEYAKQLAEAVEDHGIRSEVYERIGAIKASQGEHGAALEIADMMHHPDFVYAAVAVHQAERSGSSAARETLDRIEFSSALCSALQSIAAGQIEKGEFENAVATLDEALAAAEEIEHNEERIRVLCEIGNEFIAAKRNDKAIETFDAARTYAEEVSSVQRDLLMVTCSIGFLNAGSLELADNTLDQVTDKTQLASALLVFARDSWKKEEKEDAIETLEEAYAIINSQRDTEIRDSRARSAVLASLAAQFAAFGKHERAVEIAQLNPNPQEKAAALIQIVQIMTHQDKEDLARDTLLSIDEDADRVSALLVMSDARKRMGDDEAAISILDEASEMTEAVPQIVARSRILNDLASRFAANGNVEKVRVLAIENLKIIETIRDESSRAAAIAELHAVYQNAGLDPLDNERTILQRIVRRASS